MVDFTTVRARARDVITTINKEGMQHPAFARDSQIVATTAALLDTLPAPSDDGVDRV
jgi:hypothetical protein